MTVVRTGLAEAAPVGGTGGEFATRWPVLLGATLGIGVGVIALPSPAIGVFMRALQAEFGWTRTEISLGPTILIGGLALASPLLGWVADRVSAVWITAVALTALAASFVVFSQLGPDIRLYYATFALMAVTACGAATLVYARVVSANFVRGRGLALGLAMVGNGLTGILLPMLLVPYAASAGWRQGFLALAVLVALAAPAVAFLMSLSRPQAVAITAAGHAPGVSFDRAVKDRTFWIMALAFALIPLGAGGLHLHLLAFLADEGVPPATAGAIAGLGGFALIVGRVLTGWLIDRAFAPHVAAGMMAISAACIGSMGLFGAPAGWLGAVAIGLSIGAELDLIGYLTARYFGMRAYGRIYGLLYAAVLVGSAMSPLAYGRVSDLTGGYALALFGAAGVLALAAVLFLTLRRFPEGEAQPSASE
ncbi:MAG: MFS transporter [Phenylobacterium sp.]|uniref:MFS transporter n=1 Tax=Phenylobacterium sp. TaxID=1871053 RepID=UPI00121856EA|nr:MFS transporter [Phenylobacterium sp.]TAJ74708.1 MAG: MFS transporter [Phenylobacterium sp.]